MGSALQTVKPGDWVQVRRNFQRIKYNLYGPSSTPTFAGITITGLSASRLVWTDATSTLASKDLVDLVAGVANEIDITDDGAGGVVIGIVDPLIVAKGGTGAATLTDHGILLGSGTGAITALGVATNGQLPIGSTGADPVLAALTGTANQITVTNGAGTITLATPQDIAAASSPTFTGLTLSGLTVSRLVATDGSNALISSDLVNWVTGTANQITVTDDTDGTITLSTPQDIDTTASPTFVTVDLTSIADGNIPYIGAGGFADSVMSTDGTNIGISVASPGAKLHVAGGNVLVNNLYGYLIKDSSGTARWGLRVQASNHLEIGDAGLTNIILYYGGSTIIGDGGSANYVQFAADGELTLAGTARVIKHLVLPITAVSGASAPTARVTESPYLSWTFEVATTDDASFTTAVPHDMDFTADVNIYVEWYTSVDQTDDEVNWQLTWNSKADGEAVNAGSTTDTSGDQACPTQWYRKQTLVETIPGNSIAADDLLGLNISRIAIVDGTNPTVGTGSAY